MTGIGSFKGRRHRWFDELNKLELEVLSPQARGDPTRMDGLFRDDFIEFGSSGRVNEKRMLIKMIAHEDSAKVLVRDFSVRQLGADTALVTFRSVGQSGQGARRSPVWVKEGKTWRMAFHYGTRMPNSGGTIA